MAKVWLAVAPLGWIAFAAGITYVGGTETGDWDYALGTGLKRLGSRRSHQCGGPGGGHLASFGAGAQGPSPDSQNDGAGCAGRAALGRSGGDV